MVVAGNETTTKLLANAWYWAWRNPDQRAKPFADPSRIGDWVEETLRYDTSSQVLARTATEDIEVAGGVIPDGGRVLLLVGSANRDHEVVPDGDPTTSTRHRSWSFGVAATSASAHRWPGSRPICLELVSVISTTTSTRPPPRAPVNVRGFATCRPRGARL
jgi:cytochrome P450